MISLDSRLHTKMEILDFDYDKPVETICEETHLIDGVQVKVLGTSPKKPSEYVNGQKASDYSLDSLIAVGADLRECVISPNVLQENERLVNEFAKIKIKENGN